MKRVLNWFVCALLAAAPLEAFAQSVQGGIRGAVLDAGGAVIPGVELLLSNEGTNAARSTMSNEQGQYVFGAVAPGPYRLTATLPGFKTFTRSGINLGAAQFLAIDVLLEVGAITDEVAVVADVPLIETSNASNAQTLPAAMLDVLPNPGRNAFIMAQTVPTVVPVGDPTWNRQQDQNGSSSISLAGGPVRGNNYTIDGVSVTDVRNRAIISPGIESIAEVKVQVNTFDSEMGRTGGGVFNTLAKSGNNEWHGSALLQNRPGWGTANNWFANRSGIPLDKNFSYWLGGGSVGGPIRRDKTFFWFGTENYHDDSQLTGSNVSVPTLAQRQGDFSQTVDASGRPVIIYDPLTTRANPNFNANQPVSLTNPQYLRDPFPGNRIPANRLNPIAVALTKYWPTPDPDAGERDGQRNYVRTATLVNTAQQYSLKLDHTFNQKFSISAFSAYQDTKEPFAAYYEGESRIADPSGHILNRTAKVLALNGTLTPNARSVISFRYGYSGFDDFNVPQSAGFDIGALGFSPNFLGQRTLNKFPSISVTGSGFSYRGLGDAAQNDLYYYAHNANVAFSRFVGRHSLRYGADFRYVGAYYLQRGQGSGTFAFSEGFTRLDPAITDTRAGNGFASFLLGHPSSVTMLVAEPLDGYFRYYAGYLQDDFRVSQHLTFNMGLRYEYEEGMREKQNRITVGFDRDARNPISDFVGMNLKGGLRYAGVDGAPTQQGDPPKTKFGPRIGLAWSAGKFAIRGGYGIFYAPEQYTSPSSTAWAVQGYTVTDNAIVSSTGTNLFPVPGVLANPFPRGLQRPQGNALGMRQQLGESVSFIDQNSKAGIVQQYTLDIQREMPGGIAVTVAYVGSWTRNTTLGGTGGTSVNLNQLPPNVQLTPDLRTQVPNPFFGAPGVGGTLGAQRTIERGQLLRPYPQFTSVLMQRVHEAFARYNALIIKVERRSNNGLTLRANWTWSKNLDNVVGEDNFFSSESNSIRNSYNLKDEYAYATNDTPHRVVVTPIYQLPFGLGRPLLNSGGWTDKLFGGWNVSTIATFQTGFPITISQTTDATTAFGGNQRPIRVPGVDPQTPGRTQDRLVLPVNGSAYINKGAYMLAPLYDLGNLARNVADIRTPGQMNFNASLGKTTSIGENVRFTFRLEANNATNTPKFAGPNGNLSAGGFGTITTQAGFSRQLQWMARVHW